jgi:SAM-dependent methyltransferase
MYEIILTIIFLLVYCLTPQNQLVQLSILAIYLGLVLPGLWTYIKGPPFVPSSDKTIQNALKLAKPKPTDIVHDLGCGNAKFLIAIAPHCQKAIGYELSLPTFLVAKWKTRKIPNIQIHYKNFWKADHSQADIVFTFLLVRLMPQVKFQIWPTLQPNAKLITNTFKLPDQKPSQKINSTILYTKPPQQT